MAHTTVYIGCAEGRAINVFDLDLETGSLDPGRTFEVNDEVQWLTGNQPAGMLYAALRSDPPRAAVLAQGIGAGTLSAVETAPLEASMAYMSVDHTGSHLLAASYSDHLVTVSSIPGADADGAVTARQSPGRHAHCVLPSPDNKFVYASALGDDNLTWWPFDEATGQLGESESVPTAPGSGPRHLQFSHSGAHLYVLHEMSGTVAVYAREASSGSLRELQTLSSIPADLSLVPGRVRGGPGPEPESNAIWCAELRLSPDNRFLYSTERSSSTVTRFAVDPESGLLDYRDTISTETQPRGMNIDPSGQYLLICGEVSDQLSIYRIDAADGALTHLGRYPCAGGPRCIEFAAQH